MRTENKHTSADLMRKQNAHSILKVIDQEKGIYRKMLAMKTNLAAQTVSNIIAVLVEKGIVLEQPLAISGKGRNPFALQINYAGFYMICVHITNYAIDVFFHSLDANVLHQSHYDMDGNVDALFVLKAALTTVTQMFRDSYIISAIVISVTGIVNEKNGVVIEAYALKWRGTNLREELSAFKTPVFVLNDVNLVAHFENSIHEDTTNFMVVKVENGVGSALVIDNHVVYSSNRVSGEFGHVTAFKSDEMVKCFCGRTNCLTQFVSKGSLERRLKKTYSQIKESVKKGDPIALGMVEEIGTLIAPKLADLIVMLDLDRVVLMGEVMEDFKDIIFPRIQEWINTNLSFWIPFHNLELKKYDCFAQICSRYVMDFYFSNDNESRFLWDALL